MGSDGWCGRWDRLVGLVLGFVLLGLGLVGCTLTRVVVPLEVGTTRVSIEGGGPLFHYGGVVIPVPLSAVSVQHGLGEGLTVQGGVHTTAALFGLIGLDGGLVWSFREFPYWVRPVVSVQGVLYTSVYGGTRFFPQVSVHVVGEGGRWLPYLGLHQVLELKRRGAHDVVWRRVWLPAVYGGVQYRCERVFWQVELLWFLPGVDPTIRAVEWVGLPGGGVPGIRLGASFPLRWSGGEKGKGGE